MDLFTLLATVPLFCGYREKGARSFVGI